MQSTIADTQFLERSLWILREVTKLIPYHREMFASVRIIRRRGSLNQVDSWEVVVTQLEDK